MENLKRSLILILIFVFCILTTPTIAANISNGKNYYFIENEFSENDSAYAKQNPSVSESEAYQRMIALQSQYPEGMHWTNDDHYISQGKLGVIGLGGYGCHAFALILSDAAFGNAPFYEHYDISKVKVGDILRINNDTHTVIVLEVHPDSFTIAEGNYNSSIHWGRSLSKANLNPDFIWTRYSDSATSTPVPSPSHPITDSNEVSIFRIYNPGTGEHLYTSDLAEVLTLILLRGWNDEGVGWNAPAEGLPVYRLYNPISGDHLYTTDVNEKNQLALNAGWQIDFNDNPLFYAGGNVPVYRLYNPQTGRHLLTKDNNEYNILSQLGVWNPEGVAFNALN